MLFDHVTGNPLSRHGVFGIMTCRALRDTLDRTMFPWVIFKDPNQSVFYHVYKVEMLNYRSIPIVSC